MRSPVIAITMGDAAGVGPEIIVKAFARLAGTGWCRPLVVGDARRLARAAAITGVAAAVVPVPGPSAARYLPATIDCIDVGGVPDDLPFGVLSAVAGDVAFRCIERAVALALSGDVDAICTAPINKEALHAAASATVICFRSHPPERSRSPSPTTRATASSRRSRGATRARSACPTRA